MNARAEERFVGVDVADAGEDDLIEQRGFDGAFRTLEARVQVRRANRERVGPKRVPVPVQFVERSKDAQASEAA